jgi:hypothetical protein
MDVSAHGWLAHKGCAVSYGRPCPSITAAGAGNSSGPESDESPRESLVTISNAG